MRQRSFRARKIDQHIASFKREAQIVGNLNVAGSADQLARILLKVRATGTLQRSG